MQVFNLSLNFRLIIIIVTLITATLGYMMKTSLTMQVNDSLHNAYQNQLIENKLIGEKISSQVDSAINSLKIIASQQPIPEDLNYQERIKSLLNNQQEIDRIYLMEIPLVKELGQEIKTIYQSNYDHGLNENKLVAHWVSQKYEILKNKKLAFANLTGDKGFSQVGVLLADWDYDSSNSKVLVVIGILKLKIGDDLPYYLEVADIEGWRLYSSEITNIFSKQVHKDKLFNAAFNSQVNSGTLEFESDDKKQLGSYYKTKHNLVVMMSQPIIKVMSSIYELIQKIVLAGIIALSIGIIAAIKLSRSITKPIENLCDATEKIAAGDFNIKVNTKSKDEVGFLANSFEKMSKKLQSLLKEQVEKVRLENELNIAATVQKTLLPENNLNNDVLYMNSFYASAAECGGDIWHYFVKNNKLVIMIADATGHGLGSAFVTVSARTVFSMIKQMAETNEEILNHPSYMITQANGAVYDVAKGGIMMTLFLGILDLETGQLVYVNAGHNPPWILKNGSKTEACAAPGLRLGENQNVPDYLAKTTHMNPGDMLFLYTDGITEGTDSQAQQFGKKTVRKILESNIGLGPEKAFNSLITEFNEFSKGKSFDDDVTAVIIQLKKYKIQGAA